LGRGASSNSIPEIERARFLFVIGSNTTEAHPVLALRIKKAVRDGGTLVVADPRKIWLTKLAKRHLQLRPGTDVWLINAMMNVILEEGLQDEDYIREFTDDFDAVREVVARYTPEEAEKVTGVPAEDIRATAREYATERHAAIFYTLGITEHACGVDNIWSLSNLVLMTGHLGYESTGLNALRGQNNVQGLNDSGANPMYLPGYQPVDDPEIRAKFEARWGAEIPETTGYRLDQMMSGLHDGRMKALYLIGENPAQTEPNAHHVEEGLGKLDFLISQDIFLNDMSEKHADVVFPASSFAEKEGTFTNTERRISRVREAAPLPGEARGDREIVILMAKALGCDWPEYPDAESVWNELADLAPNWYGVRYDRLEENGVQWPVTEIGGPDTQFLYAPAPARAGGRGKFFPVEYQRPIEEPDSEYPLVLSTGRTLYHYNSATMTMRELGITEKQEEPFFEIHADDAIALGLGEGDMARLVSRRGELHAKTQITDRVFPGLVWMALHFAEQKVNWLTHDVGDPLIGTPEFKVSAVRVERVGEPLVRPRAPSFGS
jgi:predicted molibdopterin-dependent oxidoreductase YjgC